MVKRERDLAGGIRQTGLPQLGLHINPKQDGKSGTLNINHGKVSNTNKQIEKISKNMICHLNKIIARGNKISVEMIYGSVASVQHMYNALATIYPK